MSRPHRLRRTYDHRIRDAIAATGNPNLFEGDGVVIPLSTRRTWIRGQFQPAVTFDQTQLQTYELLDKVHRLEKRAKMQAAIIALLMRVLTFRGGKLNGDRMPQRRDKSALLRTLEAASKTLGLDCALRVVGLSRSRYHAWRRKEAGCGLTDESSCPKSFPTRLTFDEVATMRDFVESPDYRHIAICNLAVHTQRLGKLFACAGTWYKLIKRRGWKRPRRRLHPDGPRVGLRADRPNQYWHTDATVIRLTTGVRVYLQAIIDNFSRRILSWRVTEVLTSETTRELLVEAAEGLDVVKASDSSAKVSLIVDGGSENLGSVDELLEEPSYLTRILAQTDIVFSNSLIEAWWRQLKHTFLFMHVLDSAQVITILVGKYVEQHNSVVGRSILGGRTPDEVYFGCEADLPDRLAASRETARRVRIETNRARACGQCAPGQQVVSIQPHRNNAGVAA